MKDYKPTIFVSLLVAIPLLSACSIIALQSVSNTTYNEPAVVSTPGTDTAEVTISGHQFQLEVADSDRERAEGLMFRQTLAPDHGMIFVFNQAAPRSFWMRNTYISLDMLFVNSDNEIVTIHERTNPLQERPTYDSDIPAQYVIELPAGTVTAKNIRVGDVINLENL